MKYLVDTNVCIYFLNHSRADPHPQVVERFRRARPDSLAISAMTLAELRFGAESSARVERNSRRVDVFALEISVLPFDDACADRFGRLKARLRRAGKTIPDFDVAIAATALATGRILASHDRHMQSIDGLEIEDWTA